MERILLAIHVLLALGIIITVLLQRSEGGGLGIGGGGGNAGMMSARGSANLLTRATAVMAACFMLTSLGLALLAGRDTAPASIIDQQPGTSAPATQDGSAAQPAVPDASGSGGEEPQAPVSE